MARIVQKPKVDGNWLYHQESENERIFADYILIDEHAEPWAECTDAEKVAWEEAHPMPTPEDGENADA